jgi:ATPase subunit of ABC transporter with duplicated ATPase domains
MRGPVSFNIGDLYRLHAACISKGEQHGGIVLVRQRRHGFGEYLQGLLRLAAARSAEEMLHQVVFLNAWMRDEMPSHGDQRRLEIARALAQGPDYLLLDEPAAGMNERETDDLQRLLVEIVQSGVTVVLMEHDVNLVMETCDRVAARSLDRQRTRGGRRGSGRLRPLARRARGDRISSGSRGRRAGAG